MSAQPLRRPHMYMRMPVLWWACHFRLHSLKSTCSPPACPSWNCVNQGRLAIPTNVWELDSGPWDKMISEMPWSKLFARYLYLRDWFQSRSQFLMNSRINYSIKKPDELSLLSCLICLKCKRHIIFLTCYISSHKNKYWWKLLRCFYSGSSE